ncbi:MAG: LysR family transcriptional regulator [Neisseriaceae bacterium]|nr:LysR family transcriptional regulator [Neisseriaceae bacterium]
MKLQQLRYALEVYLHNLNVSEAAEALFTSQPGISKQIRLLEEEIGTSIFVRQGKRFIAVTEPGEMVLAIADRILRDTKNIKKIGDDFAQKNVGKLSIASIPSWINNKFPSIFGEFIQNFPDVKVSIVNANTDTIRVLLENGEIDIGIAVGNITDFGELHCLPFDKLKYCLIVRKNHQLANKKLITLSDLNNYPILAEEIMCDEALQFTQKFVESGLDTPEIIMKSSDNHIIAQLVQQKFGIGIVSHYFNINNDDIIVKDISNLFDDIHLNILLKNNYYLRGYLYEFIEKISPNLDRNTLQRLLYQPIVDDYSI